MISVFGIIFYGVMILGCGVPAMLYLAAIRGRSHPGRSTDLAAVIGY
jgi:hypothetical protein